MGFLQLHVGIFGTHRNEKKTEQMILALAWWEKMSEDIKNWVKQCLTCIRFRQRPTKQETGPVKPTHLHPWQEVMVDCEGTSQPADEQGCTYP